VRVPLDHVLDGSESLTSTGGDEADPQTRALQAEAIAVLREGIERHLTERQQQALRAVVFEQVPLDEVARHWGSNRNEDEELSCSACDLLPQYVDLEVAGEAPDSRFPLLPQHLQQCPVCRDEYVTLRELARLEAEGRSPSIDDLRRTL
jgi:hypothetical protein